MGDFGNQIESLKGKLDKLPPTVQKELMALAIQSSLIIVNAAKKKIKEKKHIKTGTLRRSIAAYPDEKTDTFVTCRVGSDIYYALYVELLPDGGYLFESMTQEGERVNTYFQKGLQKILRMGK